MFGLIRGSVSIFFGHGVEKNTIENKTQASDNRTPNQATEIGLNYTELGKVKYFKIFLFLILTIKYLLFSKKNAFTKYARCMSR